MQRLEILQFLTAFFSLAAFRMKGACHFFPFAPVAFIFLIPHLVTDKFRLPATPLEMMPSGFAGLLRQVLGIRSEELDVLCDDEEVRIEPVAGNGFGVSYQ
jgi:hypothetical protein